METTIEAQRGAHLFVLVHGLGGTTGKLGIDKNIFFMRH